MRRVAATWLFAGAALTVCLPAESVVERQAPALLQKVETQRRQPLSAEQRTQFSRTAASMHAALVPAHRKFARTVAETFNLSEADVGALLPATDSAGAIGFDVNVIAKIEARRGRPVTTAELQQLRMADNAKKAEMSEIQARYTTELSRISGVSREQIERMLPLTGI